MLRLNKDQQVCKIGKVKVGGQPGENPTLLLGTMFYNGHKIIENRKTAKFDKKRAEELINQQETLSDETGVPGALDLVANFTPEIEKYIDFVTGVTDMPFSIDIWTVEPKLGGAKYIAEQGLTDKAIYSSIAPWSKDIRKEIDTLKDLKLKHAILVAFDMADKSVEARIRLLDNTLLPQAKEAGFQNYLLDTAVLTLPSVSYSCLANRQLKEKYGYPTGCAPSNGTDVIKKDTEGKWGKNGFIGLDSGAHALASLLWNDWLLYGAIEHAKWMFPAVAIANVLQATLEAETVDQLPADPTHPLNKLFAKDVEELKKAMTK
jgi:tetrahydromethanopterin S-methyltransferase subunit H